MLHFYGFFQTTFYRFYNWPTIPLFYPFFFSFFIVKGKRIKALHRRQFLGLVHDPRHLTRYTYCHFLVSICRQKWHELEGFSDVLRV